MYYRFAVKNEDIFQVESIELPASLFSMEEMLDMNGVDSEDELENTLHFDSDGNLVYAGVCCCGSIEGLQEYMRNNVGVEAGDYSDCHVVEFDGEWLAGCSDGDVVKPVRIVRVYEVESFMKLVEGERK